MRIKVTSRPDGDPPPELRDQWIGVEMYCDPLMVQTASLATACGATPRGVVSGLRISRSDPNANGFPIQIEECMSAFRNAGRHDAARQWEEILAGSVDTLSLVESSVKSSRLVMTS